MRINFGGIRTPWLRHCFQLLFTTAPSKYFNWLFVKPNYQKIHILRSRHINRFLQLSSIYFSRKKRCLTSQYKYLTDPITIIPRIPRQLQKTAKKPIDKRRNDAKYDQAREIVRDLPRIPLRIAARPAPSKRSKNHCDRNSWRET